MSDYDPKKDPVEKLLHAWMLYRSNRGPAKDSFQAYFNERAEEDFRTSLDEGLEALAERYQALQNLTRQTINKAEDYPGYSFRRDDVACEMLRELSRILQIGMPEGE